MASLDVGGSGGRRKSLDTNIPLVPFIDLLLCCVMFLLVTAVWNELASLPADVASDGAATVDAPTPDNIKLAVLIQQDGYVISTGTGDRVTLPRHDSELDKSALATRLTTLRHGLPPTTVDLIPDDDIPMSSVTDTMDTIRGAGFERIAVATGM